jgi:hypothetical protein
MPSQTERCKPQAWILDPTPGRQRQQRKRRTLNRAPQLTGLEAALLSVQSAIRLPTCSGVLQPHLHAAAAGHCVVSLDLREGVQRDLPNITGSNPCASMIASVQRFGLRASSRSARRCSSVSFATALRSAYPAAASPFRSARHRRGRSCNGYTPCPARRLIRRPGPAAIGSTPSGGGNSSTIGRAT